jgi:hypothetical protein
MGRLTKPNSIRAILGHFFAIPMAPDPHHRPDPRHRYVSPKSRDEWIVFWLFFGTIGLLFLLSLLTDFDPKKLSPIFFCLSYLAFLVLHEASHALMAHRLNWRVEQVVIGFGKPVFQFRWAGIPVQICLFPLSGFVLSAPRSFRHWRIKNALIYFAGPGSTLVVMTLIAWALGEQLFTPTDRLSTLFWQSVALSGTVSAVPNLLPHMVPVEGRMTPNDGLGMILSFWLPDHYFEQQFDRRD